MGLLFSADWCPPCQTFLQILKDFYSDVNIDEKQCEILYVSLDKTEEEFKSHYTQMPWLSLHFADPLIKVLSSKYKVVGIPVFVIVDSETGFLVTVRGRKDIHERNTSTIDDWAKLLELNREKAIKKAEEERLAEIAKQKKIEEQLL